MIENQRQYQITKQQLQRLRRSLKGLPKASLSEVAANPISPFPAIHPLLQQAQKEGLQSLIGDLEEEIEVYESSEEDWGGGGDYAG